MTRRRVARHQIGQRLLRVWPAGRASAWSLTSLVIQRAADGPSATLHKRWCRLRAHLISFPLTESGCCAIMYLSRVALDMF